ncbi:MAG: hypothetical protein QME51_04090 [Planctomycetota bacterium]|nr:hypothetical protein [Planctomycetota bacterium]MDI6787530.1 hypothetical protein [Planctomycetota bacterium]
MYKKILTAIAGGLLFILSVTNGVGTMTVSAQDKSDDTQLREKIHETARQALVQLHFEFQKDPEEGEPKDKRIKTFIANKMTMDTTGLLVGSAGTILTTDLLVEKKYVKKITVIDYSGIEYEAELKGFLQDYPALFLSIKGEKRPSGGVRFALAGEINSSRKLFSASLFKSDEKWFLNIGPVGISPNKPYLSAEITKPWLQLGFKEGGSPLSALMSLIGGMAFGESGSPDGFSGGAPVLFDENGNVIGYPLEGRIEPDGNTYGWRGTDLMENTLITFTEFDKKQDEIKNKFLNYVVQVKFAFRQKEKDAPSSPYDISSMMRSFMPGGSDEHDDINMPDKKLYGLIISKNQILVPDTLMDDLIHRIENIEVSIGDKTSPAEFVGVYKDFGAILIKVTQDIIKDVPQIYKASFPPHGRIVYALRVKEKFDKRFETVNYDRFMAVSKGYKNRIQHTSAYSKETGTIFLNQNNEIFAVLMEEKRDISETISSEKDYSYYMSFAVDMMTKGGVGKTFFFNELKESLISPTSTAHFDIKLVPLSDREMKRIICLGVEFQSLTKELSEQLNCQKITRNGEIGLLLSHIYPGSSAEKAKLQLSDILLKIQEQGKDDPIELSAKKDYSNPFSGFSQYGDFDMGDTYGGGTPWPNRNNYFTKILTRIGAGKKVTLTYWRDGQELKQEFILEKAPYDFDSAEKYKDETIGITIKDLTYEVKHFYRLAADYKAVITSKIEEGSKAAIGKLRTYELITKINEQPVGSVEEYKKLMDKLIKEQKQRKFKFTIERKGKTRFVDIELDESQEQKPAEKEGNEKEE